MAKKVRYNLEKSPSPMLYIPFDVYQDMLWIAKATKDEVSFFGEVDTIDTDVFQVRNVSVPEQQASGSTVEIEPKDLEAFALEYLEKHGTEAYNRLRLWGHSHHTMGVQPSGQDQGMIDSLTNLVRDTFIALRINHRGDVQVDVAYYDTGITVEDSDYAVGTPNPERKAEWEAIVKARVRKITYTPTTPKGGSMYAKSFGHQQATKTQNSHQGKGNAGGHGKAGGSPGTRNWWDEEEAAAYFHSGYPGTYDAQAGQYNPNTRTMEAKPTVEAELTGTSNPYIWDPQVRGFRRYANASRVAKDNFDDTVTTGLIPSLEDLFDAWEGVAHPMIEGIEHLSFESDSSTCEHDFVTIMLEDGSYETLCGNCLETYSPGMKHVRDVEVELK